ncbi:unnamed protein product [Closterium sp. NIES-53]
MRPLWTAQDSPGTVRCCSRSILLAFHCCSRPPASALPVPVLSDIAIVEDLVSHLRTSGTRYRTTFRAEFLDRNQPPMFITLYFIVTRLPDSLHSVRDHFLSLDPTSLTVNLLEQHLLAAETSALAVGAARGTPRPPFFEGCSPSPLAPSYASSATAADVSVAEDVGAASASAKRLSRKGKGGKGGGCGSGSSGGGSSGGGGGGGTGGGSGGSGGSGGGSGGSGGGGGSGSGGGGTGARRVDLLRSRIAIFDLDFDAIISTMYALSISAEGDCYRCVPPDPGIAAAALGASESGTLPGTAPAKPLHNFTLDSGASRCFFCDSTTLTPLPTPVPIRLADPSGGPVVARSSTVLPYVAVPSGSLLGLHLPSFSTNLTLLWHHHLGHPSLPCLRGMHSRLLVSRLPRSLPPLLPSPTPPCLPCFEGRQRAAPHSSSFPPTTAPLQTLHIDVWGPARVSGQSRERYFLLVVDDYTRYTTLFPLRTKGEVVDVFIPWIRTAQPASMDSSTSGSARTFLSCVYTLTEVRRIGLVMEVARTSMIHAAAPHFMWPFAVRFTTPPRAVSSGVSQVDPLPDTAPVEVAVGSGAARGAASGGAACGGEKPGGARSEGAGSGGAEPGGEEPGGLDPEGVEPGGAESEGAEFGGAEPRGVASSGSPAGGAGDTGAGGAGVLAGARGTGGTAAAGRGGARTRGAGAAGIGGVGGARAGDPTEPGAAGTRAGGARGTVRPRPYFVPLLQQVPGVPSSTAFTPPLLCPPPDQSQPPLQPASPLPAPSFYTEKSGGLTECRQPASRPTSFVCTARRVPHSRPPPVPSTHAMALRPSSIPLRVPLPAPPESSLPESAAACALVAELLDFAAACRLDYATALVAESGYASPSSIRGECALGTDVLEDRQEDFECLAAAAITGPYSSQWLAAMDAEMASWNTIGTYVDEVPPPGANIVDGMWIFRLKRPPGSPPAFKARYVARGFSQRQGVDYFQTFFPIPKMTTLWVLLHVAAQRDYELHSLCFSTAFLQGSLHEEIWLRRPPSFTESFRAGTPWSLRRPIYGLRQAPHEWHDTQRTTIAAQGFTSSTADLSLFLRTDTSLSPFYVLVYVNDLVFATADTEALTLVKSELQKRHTCTYLGELRSYRGAPSP